MEIPSREIARGEIVNKPSQIPLPVIRRLTKYLARLQRLRQTGQEWVSSQELARALSLTDSTVRQDLSHLEFSGRAKRGYQVEGLQKTLTTVLGLDAAINAVIIGAGNLGRALAQHEEFPRQGFRICGVFDLDSRLFGRKLGDLVVQSTDALPDVVRKEGVAIGIIAVPPSAAQQVAGELVACGVRGVLNLACAHVSVPDDVAIVDGRLVESLLELSCAIRMQGGAP